MVDIETLSTQDNATVLSIGAVKFDMKGEILDRFYMKLNLDEQANRHISISTMKWWLNQVAEHPASNDIFITPNVAPVKNSLDLLRKFLLVPVGSTRQVWANDPDFDMRILDNLAKEYDTTLPWAFYEFRSVRTAKMVAQQKGYLFDKSLVTHHALEDCIRQVDIVTKAFGDLYETV